MLNQIAELINEEVEPSKQTLQMQMQVGPNLLYSLW